MPRDSNKDLSRSLESISNNSAFDWGSIPSNRKAPIVGAGNSIQRQLSRYDPTGAKRITDITDLVDDEDSDDDTVVGDIEMNRNNRKTKRTSDFKSASSHPLCRQTIMAVALLGIIAGASVAIGFIITASDTSKTRFSPTDGPDGGIAQVPLPQQSMLEIAERVVTACDENKLDEDISECQQLCRERECCFVSGEYSCENDESKICGVYAGCEALIIGIPTEAAEEEEE